MYGLVIGASSESVFAIKQAQAMGFIVLGFDGDKNAEGLKYVDEGYVVDIRHPENVYEIIKQKGIDRKDIFIIPVPIGRSLITSGAVKDYYDLKGVSKSTADKCTDKFLFHNILNRAGLRNISSHLLKKGELPNDISKFPIIVKPRFGAGSRAVIHISNISEWNDFRKNAPYKEDFIIEEAVVGEEYGIDGIVINNEFNLVLLRKKKLTIPPIRQCVAYISIIEDEKNKELIDLFKKYVQSIVDELEIEDGIIHADMIYDGKKPFVIELSVRPSGHHLYDLFTPKVTGINMIKEYLSYITGDKKKILFKDKKKQELQYMIHFFDISDSYIVRIPNEMELRYKYPIEEYQCNLQVGYVPKVIDGKSLISRGFFIIKDRCEENLMKCAENILNEFIK